MESTFCLLTDFGSRDGYVGVMKAVLNRKMPKNPIIDLSHEIPPQQVGAAAFVLWNSYRYFAAGCIFVVVVDPGVGSARKILLLKTEDYYFIAPDNGVLDWVLAAEQSYELRELDLEQLEAGFVSNTFHGRDIFAPIAAKLAGGTPFEALGPLRSVSHPPTPFHMPTHSGTYEGQIQYIDIYGNLISNLQLEQQVQGIVEVADQRCNITNSYAAVRPGELLALQGSHGLLEVAVRNGNAALSLGVGLGDPIRLKIE